MSVLERGLLTTWVVTDDPPVVADTKVEEAEIPRVGDLGAEVTWGSSAEDWVQRRATHGARLAIQGLRGSSESQPRAHRVAGLKWLENRLRHAEVMRYPDHLEHRTTWR